MSSALIAHRLFFRYDAATSPLFHDLDLHFPRGWTGVVGPNGAGKTTLLRIATGLLEASGGTIRLLEPSCYCTQRTDDPPAGLESLLETTDPDRARIRSRLGIQPDWSARWETLSHGERKRAQIAAALASDPALLAIDEPTNHLDREARRMLGDSLTAYRGVGILVSHDRELLDCLCLQCLFLDPPAATMRPGGYTAGAAQAADQRTAGRRRYLEGLRRAERLGRETARRREEASHADRRRSKRDLDVHDSDGKARINLAVFTGKDGQAGRLKRQMEGRLRRAEDEAAGAYVPPERVLRFWLPGSVYKGDAVARLAEGALSLGDERTLEHPELSVSGRDRVAVCGANGSGKSTLVRAIVASLTLPRERFVYLPQEIPAPEARAVAREVRSLPESRRGALMTVVAGLGSDPRRLLSTDLPSPGETRKLLLALGVVREPWLVVMDEPTNHLDLPSIELLERALADCPCALLLVSHDERFLDAVGCRRWVLEARGAKTVRLDIAPART